MACMRDNFQHGILLDDRYETISPLNSGSFGMVFKARDIKTGQTVAIKCLTKQAAESSCPELAIDDRSEEESLHGLLGSHANIVNLLRSFETESHFYLVLEFCERGDLYEAIRKGHGPLETEHVRQFMLQLVDAVSYIHSKGVYHRDIKPENIFLTHSGDLKLGDFGLATTENWTLENTVGSDRYMSPEQYDSAGAGYSPAQADIWAIGICLLNILFSRNPFTTPTEADPLFLDFSRDKQSLFDVFPDMSQDTYEVIVQCMSLDPRKRSLIGARAALLRVVSFTTCEEDIDDFCCDENPVVATANREPLRTPSIQSPQVDQGAFPWTKALHNATQPRQLSVIPDNESYSEDLFSKSGATGSTWFSASVEAPSITSTIDSALAMSFKSMAVGGRPIPPTRQPPRVSPMAGSLPINMAKPRGGALKSVGFGRLNDVVSKSWSDMWEEDEEEEELERQQVNTLKHINSRTWSHESTKVDDVNKVVGAAAQVHGDIDGDIVADGFFFQEALPPKEPAPTPERYSPPPKRNPQDKWAALGEKRRAVGGSFEPERSPLKPRRQQIGFGYGMPGFWEHAGHTAPSTHSTPAKPSRERSRECPWNKGRESSYWRREKRAHLGDIEWVGGWQEAHS